MTISGLGAAVAGLGSALGAGDASAGFPIGFSAGRSAGRGCSGATGSLGFATGAAGSGCGVGAGRTSSCFDGAAGGVSGSSFGAAAGCGAAGFRLPPERSILPTIFGPVRISSRALITPLLMTTSFSNSPSWARGESFLSCSDTLSGFRFIRSRTLTLSLALRLPPNSFSRTA